MYGNRPPTGSLAHNRPPTANRARSAATARPATCVTRPTTQQQGLASRSTSYRAGGRQIHDSTYFSSQIRLKIALVTTEIATLSNQAEQYSRENSNLASFEKRASLLSDDLRELQAQLGDLNTLVDKLHADADLEDIERSHHVLREKNQQEHKLLDDIFALRQRKDEQAEEISSAIESHISKSEKVINNLSPLKLQQYNTHKSENAKFLADILLKQHELDSLTTRMNQLSKEIRSDSLKQSSMAIHEKRFELLAKKLEIEQDLAAMELESGPNEKAKLLEQVKQDNLETVAMERKISDLDEEAKTVREEIAQFEMNLESTQQSEKNAKFDELVRRDKEIQSFIDSFDSKMKENRERNAAMEHDIVDTMSKLNHLARSSTSGALSTDQANSEQLITSDYTSSRQSDMGILERNQRLTDLEKVNLLEGKLEIELRHLKSKQTNLAKELKKIGNIDEYKGNAEALKQKNIIDRELLQIERDLLRGQVSHLSNIHDTKSAQLNDNETHVQLASLEQKIQHHESNNFQLKE